MNVSYSVGDSPENVDENLSRAAAAVGSERGELFSAHQVHGRDVTLVDAETAPRPRCDVLITRSSARTLMLPFTARPEVSQMRPLVTGGRIIAPKAPV